MIDKSTVKPYRDTIKVTHYEVIKCPGCCSHQIARAVLYDGMPFWSYVHKCGVCGYTIIESEWERVKQPEETSDG